MDILIKKSVRDDGWLLRQLYRPESQFNFSTHT